MFSSRHVQLLSHCRSRSCHPCCQLPLIVFFCPIKFLSLEAIIFFGTTPRQPQQQEMPWQDEPHLMSRSAVAAVDEVVAGAAWSAHHFRERPVLPGILLLEMALLMMSVHWIEFNWKLWKRRVGSLSSYVECSTQKYVENHENGLEQSPIKAVPKCHW